MEFAKCAIMSGFCKSSHIFTSQKGKPLFSKQKNLVPKVSVIERLHCITIKCKSGLYKTQRKTCHAYRLALFIIMQQQMKQSTPKLAFRHFYSYACAYRHEVTVSRHKKVATYHANL